VAALLGLKYESVGGQRISLRQRPSPLAEYAMTNRRSALAFLMLSGALPLLSASGALAGPRRSSADDDDAAQNIPNMFISPCGEPFRAQPGAPYPVVDWFNQADANHDGKLDKDEFRADADRFFKQLDINGDGALSRSEILIYERKWVPEILGGNVTVGQYGGARLWLAQFAGAGPGGAAGGMSQPINPQGDKPIQTKPKAPGLDESGAGASPYSFFDEPEPIMTADFNVNGLILRDNFLKVADMHFDSLDSDQKGYLTLKSLPQTAVERLLDRSHGKRR